MGCKWVCYTNSREVGCHLFDVIRARRAASRTPQTRRVHRLMPDDRIARTCQPDSYEMVSLIMTARTLTLSRMPCNAQPSRPKTHIFFHLLINPRRTTYASYTGVRLECPAGLSCVWKRTRRNEISTSSARVSGHEVNTESVEKKTRLSSHLDSQSSLRQTTRSLVRNAR